MHLMNTLSNIIFYSNFIAAEPQIHCDEGHTSNRNKAKILTRCVSPEPPVFSHVLLP